MRTTGVRCGVHVPRSDRDDVAPAGRTQLLRTGAPGGHDGSVRADPYRVPPADGYAGVNRRGHHRRMVSDFGEPPRPVTLDR